MRTIQESYKSSPTHAGGPLFSFFPDERETKLVHTSRTPPSEGWHVVWLYEPVAERTGRPSPLGVEESPEGPTAYVGQYIPTDNTGDEEYAKKDNEGPSSETLGRHTHLPQNTAREISAVKTRRTDASPSNEH